MTTRTKALRQPGLVATASLALIALAMTLKYFPGLENPGAYAGNMYQAIHPDAFPGDPYIAPGRNVWEKSTQFSLLYLPAKIMGEIWLDDRVNAVAYFILVLLSVLAVDKIVRLVGVNDVASRIAIQLVFLRDHRFFNNVVLFAHPPDFNHAALAIPVTLWLFYATLARKSIWLILLLCAVLILSSVHNAPIAIAMALTVTAVMGNRPERCIVGAVFGVALIVFLWCIIVVIPITGPDRLLLWDLLYEPLAPSQISPFAPNPDMGATIVVNLIFVALCAGALLMRGPETPGMHRLRVFVGAGLLIWLVAGLYFSFAPDALKLPQVLPFTPVRGLRWPQTLAYIAILVSVFHRLSDHADVKSVLMGAAIVGGLLVIGPENHVLWAALFGVGICAVVAAHAIRMRIAASDASAGILRSFPVLAVQTLALVTAVAYGTTIWARLPAWKVLAESGVMGDAGSAPWIGVTDWLRANTSPETAVLPLEYERQHPDKLRATRYIATRGGRPTPVLKELSSMYSVQGWNREHDQRKLFEDVETSFAQGRWTDAAAYLPRLLLVPDLVLIPASLVDRSAGGIRPFVEVARVRDFAVLRPPK